MSTSTLAVKNKAQRSPDVHSASVYVGLAGNVENRGFHKLEKLGLAGSDHKEGCYAKHNNPHHINGMALEGDQMYVTPGITTHHHNKRRAVRSDHMVVTPDVTTPTKVMEWQ